MGIEVFKKHLREKRAIKVNAGYNNFNPESIAKICRSAQVAHASAVEIPCDKTLYEIARKNTRLPIFVSSIHTFDILNAVKWGVDGINIGNFSTLKTHEKKFNAEEIYDIVLEIMGTINNYDTFICVTIPSNILHKTQVDLVKRLEILGIDMVQVEDLKIDNYTGEYELYKTTNLSISQPTGITQQNVVEKFSAGASAIELNESIIKIDAEAVLNTAIASIVGAVAYKNSYHREIIRNNREIFAF